MFWTRSKFFGSPDTPASVAAGHDDPQDKMADEIRVSRATKCSHSTRHGSEVYEGQRWLGI
jgi:hypothetical protein